MGDNERLPGLIAKQTEVLEICLGNDDLLNKVLLDNQKFILNGLGISDEQIDLISRIRRLDKLKYVYIGYFDRDPHESLYSSSVHINAIGENSIFGKDRFIDYLNKERLGDFVDIEESEIKDKHLSDVFYSRMLVEYRIRPGNLVYLDVRSENFNPNLKRIKS